VSPFNKSKGPLETYFRAEQSTPLSSKRLAETQRFYCSEIEEHAKTINEGKMGICDLLESEHAVGYQRFGGSYCLHLQREEFTSTFNGIPGAEGCICSNATYESKWNSQYRGRKRME
jgi:hypothetical protein